jgi:hypothetical protein
VKSAINGIMNNARSQPFLHHYYHNPFLAIVSPFKIPPGVHISLPLYISVTDSNQPTHPGTVNTTHLMPPAFATWL